MRLGIVALAGEVTVGIGDYNISGGNCILTEIHFHRTGNQN